MFISLIFAIAFDLLMPHLIYSAPIKIGKYKVLELVFAAETSSANPFDTYLLRLEITDPDGFKFQIDGFFDGDGKGGQYGKIWKVRICPYTTGIWSWRTVRGDAPDSRLKGLSGQFECVESREKGGLIADGKHFRFQDGDSVYLQGNFLDFANSLTSTHTFMSEKITDTQRDAIIIRHRDFHKANKANIYFANKGDYESQSVTPLLGNALSNNKAIFDLSRWRVFDSNIRRFKKNRMFVELWFFADDSGFGELSQNVKNRLFRYAMARTSAFSHTFYVIALEWDEEWKALEVTRSGIYIQAHNPWKRLISVHSLPVYRKKPKIWGIFPSVILKNKAWFFSGEGWATFIASQVGNGSNCHQVNKLAMTIRAEEDIPHISEEFGIIEKDSDSELRANMWANFCGGAAGGGTGSDIKAFMWFLEQSRIPFQRMRAANSLVDGGGNNRFCLAETGHHYIIYSTSGHFALNVLGNNLKGLWFNPRSRNPSIDFTFRVSPGRSLFKPPNSSYKDWVLWISDGSNLLSGKLYPSQETTVTREVIN